MNNNKIIIANSLYDFMVLPGKKVTKKIKILIFDFLDDVQELMKEHCQEEYHGGFGLNSFFYDTDGDEIYNDGDDKNPEKINYIGIPSYNWIRYQNFLLENFEKDNHGEWSIHIETPDYSMSGGYTLDQSKNDSRWLQMWKDGLFYIYKKLEDLNYIKNE